MGGKMKHRIFVSSPYSHPSPAVMEDRVRAAEDACAWLLGEGYLPYSPIAHWHRTSFRNGLPTNANAWIELNYFELKLSDAIAFLELDGWRDSHGMAMERQWAGEMGMPFNWIVPRDGSFAVVWPNARVEKIRA